MNYHNITKDDMLNGDGLRVVLWVAGCNHYCKGCQNPETWDVGGGIPFDKDAEKELSNPDVKKKEKYQMWTMVNYLNLRDAYGENVPYTMDNSNTVVFV